MKVGHGERQNIKELGAEGDGLSREVGNRQLDDLQWKVEEGERARIRNNVVIIGWQERKCDESV